MATVQSKILRIIKKTFSLSNLLNLIIFCVAISISYYRIGIGKSYSINFDLAVSQTYDSGFFFKNVVNFDKFNITAAFPLIKNRGYFWFLLLVHNIGIDLRLAYSVFWLVASAMLYLAIFKVSKNRIISLISFIYLVLHPVAFISIFPIYGYRNIVFVPSVSVFISLCILLFAHLSNNEKIRSIICSVVLGLYFIYLYFLTETGIMYMAILLGLLAIFAIFVIYDCFAKKSFDIKSLFGKILIIVLPLIISLAGIRAYKFINYRTYGVDVINMRTEDEIARFVSNVQDIESDNTNTLIWCSADQIDKAYSVSPTFQQYNMIYQLIRTEQLGRRGHTYNFQGDFFGWAITNSLPLSNISHSNAVKIFNDINNEIESAFKYGKLQKTKKIKITSTIGRFSIEEIKKDVFDLFKANFVTLINLNRLEELYKGSFENSIDNSGEYFKFFNMNSSYEIQNHAKEATEFKNRYSKINIALFNIMIINIVIAILIVSIKFILGIYKRKYRNSEIKKECHVINCKYLLLSLFLISVYTLYVLSISFFGIWLFDVLKESEAHAFYYMCGGIVFLIFAVIFSFLSYLEFISAKVKKLIYHIVNRVK